MLEKGESFRRHFNHMIDGLDIGQEFIVNRSNLNQIKQMRSKILESLDEDFFTSMNIDSATYESLAYIRDYLKTEIEREAGTKSLKLYLKYLSPIIMAVPFTRFFEGHNYKVLWDNLLFAGTTSLYRGINRYVSSVENSCNYFKQLYNNFDSLVKVSNYLGLIKYLNRTSPYTEHTSANDDVALQVDPNLQMVLYITVKTFHQVMQHHNIRSLKDLSDFRIIDCALNIIDALLMKLITEKVEEEKAKAQGEEDIFNFTLADANNIADRFASYMESRIRKDSAIGNILVFHKPSHYSFIEVPSIQTLRSIMSGYYHDLKASGAQVAPIQEQNSLTASYVMAEPTPSRLSHDEQHPIMQAGTSQEQDNLSDVKIDLEDRQILRYKLVDKTLTANDFLLNHRDVTNDIDSKQDLNSLLKNVSECILDRAGYKRRWVVSSGLGFVTGLLVGLPILGSLSDNNKLSWYCRYSLSAIVFVLANFNESLREISISEKEKFQRAYTRFDDTLQDLYSSNVITASSKDELQLSPNFKMINYIIALTFQQICSDKGYDINHFSRQDKAYITMQIYSAIAQSAFTPDEEDSKKYHFRITPFQVEKIAKAMAEEISSRTEINWKKNLFTCSNPISHVRLTEGIKVQNLKEIVAEVCQIKLAAQEKKEATSGKKMVEKVSEARSISTMRGILS